MKLRPMPLFPSMVVLFIVLTQAAPVRAEDIHAKVAKISAQGAGYNYENYRYCNVSADDLSAFKTRASTKYAAAGDQFEPAFANGVAEAIQKRMLAISQLGEEKYKASVCPYAQNDIKVRLAKP